MPFQASGHCSGLAMTKSIGLAKQTGADACSPAIPMSSASAAFTTANAPRTNAAGIRRFDNLAKGDIAGFTWSRAARDIGQAHISDESRRQDSPLKSRRRVSTYVLSDVGAPSHSVIGCNKGRLVPFVGLANRKVAAQSCRRAERLTNPQAAFLAAGGRHSPLPGGRMEGCSFFGQ